MGQVCIRRSPCCLLKNPDSSRTCRCRRVAELTLKLSNRLCCYCWWRRGRRGRAHSGIVVGWPTPDLADADANSIAPHAMQVQTDEHVAQIARHQIVQAQDDHVYPLEARDLTDVFDFQWVTRVSAVF